MQRYLIKYSMLARTTASNLDPNTTDAEYVSSFVQSHLPSHMLGGISISNITAALNDKEQ